VKIADKLEAVGNRGDQVFGFDEVHEFSLWK
jgi:hypothetical protein